MQRSELDWMKNNWRYKDTWWLSQNPPTSIRFPFLAQYKVSRDIMLLQFPMEKYFCHGKYRLSAEKGVDFLFSSITASYMTKMKEERSLKKSIFMIPRALMGFKGHIWTPTGYGQLHLQNIWGPVSQDYQWSAAVLRGYYRSTICCSLRYVIQYSWDLETYELSWFQTCYLIRGIFQVGSKSFEMVRDPKI